MKFQKAIAIALSVAALLTMTACGSTGEPAATTAAATAAATEAAATAEQTTEAPKSVSGTVSLAGSTSMQKLCEAMIESFSEEYPDITVTAEYTGSGAGLEAVAAGKTDIGNSSRALKDSEKAAGVEENIVAIDGIAVITHTSNTVSDLTSQQLTDIYTGKITNWKELGGADANIVVVSRDTSSGTYETWEEMVMKKAKVMPKALLQASNGAVEQVVAKNPNAIGYVGLGYLAPSIKGLHIGKVAASAETALSKEWPLSRELYVFTNGEPAGASGALIKYILDPAKGQKAVKEVGFVPLAKK